MYYCNGRQWRRHAATGAFRVLSTLCNVITLRASEAAAQCIVIGPVCLFVGVWVCAFVGLLRQLEIACIDTHQTGFVGKSSDHLQFIKFWPSRAPRKGSMAERNFWLRLTASAQCLRLRLLFHFTNDVFTNHGKSHEKHTEEKLSAIIL